MTAINEVRGKLALVTGAAGGIGAACAIKLASEGIHLALTYFTNKDGMAQLTQQLAPYIDQHNLKITTYQADMGDREQIKQVLKSIGSDLGRMPDILVSNAGHGVRIPDILDISEEEWDKTLSINLTASFILTKLCVEHMIAQSWGRIIYISSIAATGTSTNGCHYSASKGGLDGMARNLAQKLAGKGITVNTVQPAMIEGTVMIPNAESIKGTPGDVKNIPVGRLGTTSEVAEVVSMFVRTGYMTGQTILLSGGLK